MKHITLLLALSALFISTHSFAQCNNVLINGDASAGISGWNFSTGSGATWVTQTNTYGPAFVASYNWCTMNQTVDLWSLGYSAQYLDNQQPEISYMQMFRGHTTNYADKYYYKIELRNASNQVITSYALGSQTNPITTTSSWDTVAGSFTNYGSGVRYVRVECGGDDAEYWAGNYGTIIDNSIVSVAQILNVNICTGSYVFNGQALSTSGQYTGNFIGQYGCDSNVILNLQVGPYNIVDTFELCQGDTFSFDGQSYTTTTALSGNFVSSAGCDSNVSYQVNFRPSYDDTILAGICPGEGYDFGGQMLYTAGTYNGAFTSEYGCDSLVTLNLVFNNVDFLQITDYFCTGSTYQFGNQTLSSPGVYVGNFTNQTGCDSTVQLTLFEDHPSTQSFDIQLCTGESISFGGQTIDETGTYTHTFASAGAGCDSVVTLEVTVTELDHGITKHEGFLSSDDSQAGTTYQWLDCNQDMLPVAGATSQSYFPPVGGRFAVATFNGICKDTSACVNYSPVGVHEARSMDLMVYPNPAFEVLTAVSTQNEIQAYHLQDLQGRIVLQEELEHPGKSIVIDVSGMARGSYILTINGKNEHCVRVISLQ